MKKFALAKSLAIAAAGAVAMVLPLQSVSAAEGPGTGKTIHMARATWDTGWFQAEIYRQLFEKLGYKVPTPTTLDNPPFYQAVGQGDVDLWVNGRFPLHNSYKKAFEQGAEPIGYVAKGGGLHGYLIDKRTAEKYHIKYLEDFKNPEIDKLFDANDDGKADMVACPPGWGCETIISYQMKAYGLEDNVNLIKAGYSAAMADAVARYQAGKPIFFFTWTPNWTVGLLKPGKDVVWLQVKDVKLPPEQESLKATATQKSVEGCSDNPCVMGLPADDIRPVANKAFLEANPAVKKLLQEVRVPVADIFVQNAKMYKGADKPSDIEKQATAWISAHQKEVKKWLADARAVAS